MELKRSLSALIVSLMGLLLLAACDPLRPAVTPTEEGPRDLNVRWDYVALGDSRTSGADWPDLYAAHIESDLGVQVTVHDRASAYQTSQALLTSLRENHSLREIVGQARIVTIWTGGFIAKDALTQGAIACEPTVEPFAHDLDDIIAEILSLRGTEETIIRLLEFYQFRVTVLQELGIFEEKKSCLLAYNGAIHQVAARYQIPVAAVHQAFNGPRGQDDPADLDHFRNDVRMSPAGDAVVAGLLRDLGYQPRLPIYLAVILQDKTPSK